MQLVSYVKNPIGYRQSDGREYITVDDVGRLKAAFKGRGILYSWVQGPGRYAFLNCQFSLQQMTQIECFTDQPGRISLELEAQPRTPCSGIRTSTGEGYIISPAFRLEPTEGPNIFLMTLVPRTSPCNVEVEKSVLAISKDESVVTVTSDAGAQSSKEETPAEPAIPLDQQLSDEWLAQHAGADRPGAPSFRSVDPAAADQVTLDVDRVVPDDRSAVEGVDHLPAAHVDAHVVGRAAVEDEVARLELADGDVHGRRVLAGRGVGKRNAGLGPCPHG